MGLDDDVALFMELQARLLKRLDAKEGELRDNLAKTKDAKRMVSGRGRKGTAQVPGEGTHGDRVLSWLKLNPGRHSVSELAKGTGLDAASVRQVVLALHGARLVDRPERGVYSSRSAPLMLPPHEEPRPEPPKAEGPQTRETPADRMKRMKEARRK